MLISSSSQALDDNHSSLLGFEDPEESTPGRVTSEEVACSLQGALFPEDANRSRSRSQDVLRDTLLDTVVWHKGERRRAQRRVNAALGSSLATLRFEGPRSFGSLSDSTISRTNSWASSVTDNSSASTCITSPSTSPISNKLTLRPLLEDQLFKQQAMGFFRSKKAMQMSLTAVKLEESPLVAAKRPKLTRDDTIKASAVKKDAPAKAPIATRLKQSMSSLVGFANRVQQSYLRAVVLQQDIGASFASQPISSGGAAKSILSHGARSLKPVGYRAVACDVQRFAPLPRTLPTRELNFSSEHNIPLLPSTPASTPKPSDRVFPPLAFVPPSPLRPRNPPSSPEWRLRPIANPCTLRLRALANVLNVEGIEWEGRAHTGRLGCGKERLTGVAIEGLGRSRLAFEATPTDVA